MAAAPPYRTLLGFDYGHKRIGVAVGQMLTRSATPLTTISARDQRPDWTAIGRLINEWTPDALVVGIPYHMDGSAHATSAAAQRFCRQLEGRYGLVVHPAEERLSSYIVESQLGGKQEAKGDIDALAAQVILQDWLQQWETVA
jgi:putative Holliday junction resolvase